MIFSLLPKVIFPALTDITAEFLHNRNIHLLMLDVDNTIVPYTTSTPKEEMDIWLKTMAASDIQLCVVSNSHKDRVKIFCKDFVESEKTSKIKRNVFSCASVSYTQHCF